jgi:hypothetical protein
MRLIARNRISPASNSENGAPRQVGDANLSAERSDSDHTKNLAWNRDAELP